MTADLQSVDVTRSFKQNRTQFLLFDRAKGFGHVSHWHPEESVIYRLRVGDGPYERLGLAGNNVAKVGWIRKQGPADM